MKLIISITLVTTTADQHSAESIINYSYDSMTRLVKEKHLRKINKKPVDTAYHEISYQYDGNNNLVKEQHTAGTKPAQSIISNRFIAACLFMRL